MSYREATFYFLTGTGNSYRATTWMDELSSSAGAATCVRPIQSARPAEEVGEGASSLLGLVMPTHGFTAPWAMLRFVMALPRRRSTHAIVVANRAGIRVGRIFLPGLEGTATYLVALILALKGYRVRGALGLDMPSNWIALHPGLHPDAVAAITARARVKLDGFMETILSGKRRFAGWLSLLFGLLLLPVSFGYLLVGRFYLSRLFFASDSCNGCSLCAQYCPLGAIKMWGSGKQSRPYWTFRCETCMRCMAYCPLRAVEAGHSWAVLLYFVTSVPAVAVLLNWLGARFPALSTLNAGAMRLILEYVYALTAMWVAYALFSLLLRVEWINRFFTVTTLTHYYRRYHEPDTSLKDLGKRSNE